MLFPTFSEAPEQGPRFRRSLALWLQLRQDSTRLVRQELELSGGQPLLQARGAAHEGAELTEERDGLAHLLLFVFCFVFFVLLFSFSSTVCLSTSFQLGQFSMPMLFTVAVFFKAVSNSTVRLPKRFLQTNGFRTDSQRKTASQRKKDEIAERILREKDAQIEVGFQIHALGTRFVAI